mgnify:FL=1
MFAPFVMDPEKGIRAWNVYNAGSPILTTEAGLTKALADETAKMYLLSGETQGSSFVGMVHLVNTTKANSNQSSSASSYEMQASFEENCWLAASQGKFGVDGQFANSIKELLSSSNIQSHASVITMGLIPSIKSNQIQTCIKTLQPDPAKVMDELAAIQGDSDKDVTTMAGKAAKAKTGESFMQLSNGFVKSAVSALGETQKLENNVINTNSLMTAFDNYVEEATKGKVGGIPINFFLKPITSNRIGIFG